MPAARAGFENCIYCHGTFSGGVPYVNITSLNNSIHGRINSGDLNYACYACHWDGTPPKTHAKNRSQIKTCESCHEGNLFNAPQVSEHIPNGRDINTGISCISCHSNSVDTNPGYTSLSDRVAHYGSNTSLMTPVIRSTNCTWCHFDNNGSTEWGTPEDPRVPGTALNHTIFMNSTQCYGCHVTGGSAPRTFHDSSLGRGGNRDCISCHDTGGAAPEKMDVSSASKSIHNSLNYDSITSLNRNNLRCWACHGDGDGSENAQPAGGHPLNYRSPKNCNNSSCHSISQSRYDETMIYSHFGNAGLNNNQNNATNYNITTSVKCEICHRNSLVFEDGSPDLALVSHYGSKGNLVDSFNCIYCHIDKDNSDSWGSATLINRNRTSLIELEKERNKFTVLESESAYLGEGYYLKVVEISSKRDEVLVRILKDGSAVDEISLGAGIPYKYEKEITIENSTFKTPIIILNITSIFKNDSISIIQFEGSRIRKIHTSKESRNSACYACHLYRYSDKKERYRVIDKEYKTNPNEDIIYYTEVFVDFISKNKSKIYFNDEDYVFSQVEKDFGDDMPFSSLQKYMKEGETWNIADNYSLKLKEISTDSKQAWLSLTVNNVVAVDSAVTRESEFNYTTGIRYKDYTETNVTVFTAKVAGISQGKSNFVILQDVVAISPGIMKMTANTAFFGYNSSWYRPNASFSIGRIPANLHAPNLATDQRNWADCVRCHGAKLRISNIDPGLGKHFRLNSNASNETVLSDLLDRACWACHTWGQEPRMHSPTYTAPRNCTSCHVAGQQPSFGAINISDEPHADEPDCTSCHISSSHNLKRFQVSPVIREAALAQTRVSKGETLNLSAKANAGYKMRIRAAEYFIDIKGASGDGTSLQELDGAFDSQVEDVAAVIDTTGISTGTHAIYIHAMERTNRWGEFYPVNFTVYDNDISIAPGIQDSLKRTPGVSVPGLMAALAGAYLARRAWRFRE